MKTKRTLCVIPCYNESYNLPSLFEDIEESGLLEHCDLLFVDDGSTDDTVRMIRERDYPIHRNGVNRGYGGSVKAGFELAFLEGYPAFVIFPGDHQRRAHDAMRMIEELEDGDYDVVVGSKFHIYSKRYGKISRRIGNQIFSKIARWIWGSPVEDVLSGFKVYRTAAVQAFMRSLPEGYPFDIVFSLYACSDGLRMREVPVNCRYDEHTSKMSSVIWVSAKMMRSLLLHYFVRHPSYRIAREGRP